MKFLSILTSAVLVLIVAPSCAAIAENQVRILLNNGAAAASDMSCSSADMILVLKSLLFTRRNLRQGKNKVDEPQSNDVDASYDSGRKLSVVFYPASCKTTCQGFATGTCVAPACKGYRREMKGLENDRELQVSSSSSSSSSSSGSGVKSTSFAASSSSTNSNGTSTSSGISMSTSTNVDSSTWCNTAASNVNMFLDLLLSGGMVSSSCAKLLRAPRSVNCLAVIC
jgi:hypothetical protein